MINISFEDIDRATKILGLGEKATLKDIKIAYRSQAKKWHPDKCKKKDQEICHKRMKQINKAYKTILKYLEDYSYSFTLQKTIEESQGEFWRSRFGKNPT